jgi:hypothetical protein
MRGMFCPVCHAEYRDGFTRCSDCDVDLVRQLAGPAFVPKADRDRQEEEDTMQVLWSGVDPRVQNRITEALGEAGIEYDDEAAKSVLLPTAAERVLEVRVFASDMDAAKKAITGPSNDSDDGSGALSAEFSKGASSSDPFRMDRSGSLLSPHDGLKAQTDNAPQRADECKAESDEPAEDEYVEQYFDPDEATAEAWSGDGEDMAELYRTCLLNIGIGCVIDDANGSVRVLVMPASEKRAKEIVRQITEQTPME